MTSETKQRRWQVIKLADDDYSAFGVLIEGPRCEDEVLLPLSDVVDVLRREADTPIPGGGPTNFHKAADFLEREFGGAS